MGINNILRRISPHKVLVENFSYLSLLQFSNLILFLIIIPYLFRVLGDEKYGLLVFAQTVALYFNILITFGFDITATRDISINRTNRDKIGEIISNVLTIKLILFIISFIILLILVNTVPGIRDHKLLFSFSMIFCLSEALFPKWYFQGIERMKYITFVNVSVRILYTIAAVFIIKKPEDYYIYPLLQGTGTFLGAVVGLIIVFGKHRVRVIHPTLKSLHIYFTDNIPIFLSNLSSQIYVNANRLILGAMVGMQTVAYYDVAERVVNIIKMPFFLLGQTLFPKISREKDLNFLKKVMIPTLILAVVFNIGIIVFALPIVQFLSGSSSQVSVDILRVLSLTIIPVACSLFLAELLLLPFNYKLAYTRMRFFSLIFYLTLVLMLYLSGNLGIYQIALVVVCVEIFVTIYSYISCRKNNIKL